MKIPKNESKEHREAVEFISKLTGVLIQKLKISISQMLKLKTQIMK